MKKGILFVILLFGFLGFGQCPTSNIVFLSQADIDAFIIDYPNCDTFDHDVFIQGADITDLSGLSQITSLTKGLSIIENPLLQNLNGLENIINSSISFLQIRNNPQLTSIDELSGIVSTNSILIENNPLLTSVDGLSNVMEAPYIWVSNNASIVDLDGFNGLLSVDQLNIMDNDNLNSVFGLANVSGSLIQLKIVGNPLLSSLAGMEGIAGVSGFFEVSDNDALLNLDGLSGLRDVATFRVSGNAALENISGFENILPQTLNEIFVLDNPSLSVCANLMICNYIDNRGLVHINNNAPGCNSDSEIIQDCGLDLNVIQGYVKYDYNTNGCDEDDLPAKSILVETIDGARTWRTLTDTLGYYKMYIDVDGLNTTRLIPESFSDRFESTPESVETTNTGFGNEENIDFCLTVSEVVNDLKVTMVPTWDARPGFQSFYNITYENVGTSVLSGNVTLQFDDTKQTLQSSNPTQDELTTNLITWNFTNLLLFEKRSIRLVLNTLPPPINEAGDILNFEAIINPISGDLNPEDNTYQFEQIVVNACDPNDKNVAQGPWILESETGNYLDYTVRFQNIGTADAINVRVEDVLSENLNWNTFRLLSSSHSYRTEIVNGNEIVFIFDNINLPPESSDPEGSKGFVSFQLKPIETIALGDVIENTADIYFDFNAAIITNTVSTTVVENLGVEGFNIDGQVGIYPNPVSSTLQIKTSNTISFEKATVYSVLGKRILETSEKQINMEALSAGIYLVEIVTDKGSVTKKIVKE